MNFDRFKKQKPSQACIDSVLDTVSPEDDRYIQKLSNLKYNKSNMGKIIQIVSATAAVLAVVTAFSLWAILGSGIRGLFEPPTGTTQTDEIKTYTVTVSIGGHLLEGADQMQGFFDDFISSKACVIKVVHMDHDVSEYYALEKGKAIVSHITTLSCRADGSATLSDDLPEGVYLKDFEFVEGDFDHIKIVLDRAAGMYFTQGVNFDGTGFAFFELPLEAVKNSSENSDRVYDSDMAQPVTVKDGEVISGKESLRDFFDSAIKGYYVSAQINSQIYRHIDEGTGLQIEGGHSNEHFLNGMPVIEKADDDNGLLSIGFKDADGAIINVMQLSTDELESLGLLFSSAQAELCNSSMTESAAVNKQTCGLITDELIKNPPKSSKTQLQTLPSFYFELNSCVTFELYKDEQGGISDVMGLKYSFETSAKTVRISDVLVSLLNEVVTESVSNGVFELATGIKSRFYDFAKKYRIDYMPVFSDSQSLGADDVRWHIYACMGFPEIFTGGQLNDYALWMYGMEFEYAQDDKVPIEIGSYNPETYMELSDYEYYQDENGENIVRVELLQYDYQEAYASMPVLASAISQSGSDTDTFIREAIMNGSISRYGQPYYRHVLTYVSDDGYMPQRFLSHDKYYRDENGQWAPNY